MNHSLQDRTLALAGIYQAITLVDRVANDQSVDERDIERCLATIFETNPDSAQSVYGSPDTLNDGLQALVEPRAGKHVALTRYVVGILHLENRLNTQPEVLAALGRGIDKVQGQADFFGAITHPSAIAALAELYVDCISPLGPRIMINGKPECLNRTETAETIRALLLAAMRSAVLWRQCGGRRWRLIIGYRGMMEYASELLAPK